VRDEQQRFSGSEFRFDGFMEVFENALGGIFERFPSRWASGIVAPNGIYQCQPEFLSDLVFVLRVPVAVETLVQMLVFDNPDTADFGSL
jgi:hypothetical protein